MASLAARADHGEGQRHHQDRGLHRAFEVQEEERTRISQDLHDEISSRLNIVSINSHLLTNTDIPLNELEPIRTTIIDQAAKALESSRRIAHNLLPPVLDKFGLDAGLKELCMEYSSRIITVNYKNDAIFNNADKKRHLHIFRIIQELINNSIRHGKATDINITFNKSNSNIQCIYSDNGKGFNVADIKNMRGLGMKNIQSRIIFLEGNITFNSIIGEGCKIVFTFN